MQSLDSGTIIILVVAVVVLLKLRSILGQRTGHQEPPDFLKDISKRQNEQNHKQGEPVSDNVVKLPNRGGVDVQERNPRIDEIEKIAKAGTKLNKSLRAILAADQSFSPKEFLGGADMAYEMIVNAFADGDKQTLRNLLSKEVFEGFKSVIDDRSKRGETVKSSFVGIDTSEITEANMKDSEAHVTIRFVSEIVSATLDKEGKVIEGDETDVVRVTDIWTFARDTRARDPNWKLVATEAEG